MRSLYGGIFAVPGRLPMRLLVSAAFIIIWLGVAVVVGCLELGRWLKQAAIAWWEVRPLL